MSVKVTIEHPSGAFMRTLDIQRLGDTRSPEELTYRDLDEVREYGVHLSSVHRGKKVVRSNALFHHRYSDDLLTLVAEAIDALGGRGGAEMKR